MATQLTGPLMPVKRDNTKSERARKITDDERKDCVYFKLRHARADKRFHGIRAKKIKDAAEALK